MSNNNITVAYPGADNWAVWWEFDLSMFQLDIVGFLAVLGESSVLANAQVSALSPFFLLPRILPAPQALIRTARPTELPSTKATVTGVYSGNVKHHIHHVAHVLLGDEMPTFMVRCVRIDKKVEKARPRRMDTFRGITRPDTTSPAILDAPVKAKANGPLTWVTLLGFFEAIVLFIASIVFGDGMSILATILLAGLSTVVGICNRWNLKLAKRRQADAPKGDVVIRYPNGSYLIVRCNEDVARELYFAPEEIEYVIKNPTLYRMLSLVGTIMLMIGIIFLANAKLQLQFAWAGAYVIINIAHWIAAAVPHRMHWDLSCYQIQEESVVGGPQNPSFTDALWKAILLTKDTTWVKNGDAAPQTDVWAAWLLDAKEIASQYGSHIGPLFDPLWKGEDPSKGTIWDGPPKEVWVPKQAWDKLNENHSNGKIHPVTAV